ncbi:hypothetical protein QTP70_032735, partial [Hemibagrus guttatus]
GKSCPPAPALEEWRSCNDNPCVVFYWEVSRWSPCVTDPSFSQNRSNGSNETSSCSAGLQTRKVTCMKINGGAVTAKRCPDSARPSSVQSCVLPCKRDCVVTLFSEWTACPNTCLPANATTPTQSRYRMVVQRAAGGGQECPDTMFEERECEPLPVCPTYRWRTHKWQVCTLVPESVLQGTLGVREACGRGLEKRALSCVDENNEPVGVSECVQWAGPAPPRVRSCWISCKDDCIFSTWSKFTECSGCKGTRTRKRSVTGRSRKRERCLKEDVYPLVESEPCVCDELISEPWGNWSVCILSSVLPPLSTHGWRGEKEVHECGDGKRYHAIACLDQKGRLLNPSQCAETELQEEACSIPCPLDCRLSSWSPWSSCSVSCGSGLRVRSRWLREKPFNGGRPCPKLDLKNQQSCTLCSTDFRAQQGYTPWNPSYPLLLGKYQGGKGRELADMMERRKVDILCVQETRWKGSKARSIGAGFKLFYYGVDSKRNGVGVVLKEEFVRNVLEVKRVSDRVMSLKLEIEGVMLNVVSGYAPQVGCELEEKERFWNELDEVMESIPTGERVVIGADFNGHVGEGNRGDEEVMGKFGVKERNLEGQMVVDFAKRMDMAVVNTYFQKREEHRVTYKSGGRRTQVDYILCRRDNLKEISDCKVVVGESVARQHRMVVCRMTLMVCKKKRSKIEIEKKTKWWKLKKEECCEEFRQKLRQALGGQVVLPDDWETTAEVIRETGRKVLGVSSGRRKEDKETWWWNEEVQDSVQRKRLAKKKWDMDRTEENRQEYKELQRRVKREVSKAKQKAYDELYTRLDTREGQKDLYRRVLTSEESVQRRWKEYFEELINEENEMEKRVEGVNSVEQKVDKIRKDEVRKALKRMKSGKAVGPDDIPVEVWKCLGEAAVEFLTSLFNRVLESERMPEEWRRSVLVPIFKNKGDVQSCSNYRGIKLMSHTMKLWERVVEARLRKVVKICEQQYGFMPRKSTTDAIFALRILMEKYRDGQRELHCVFVDLEKAYDRVPREELWYCMRKSGVAEKYVRVVQDMYERSRTVVRCAVGQTEEFKVEVGLHQGSALSPFLFAIVMDQLSEEVRQESPWTMMFADDIVICSESREQVEENLERWRFALERRGMKVSGSKTEYMCVNEREGSGTVRLQGVEVKKVQEFKYLGSTVQSNGVLEVCPKEVKKRVQAGWNGWRKVWGVLCDRKISARIMGKVYRTVVRPAMLYGLETVSLRKRQESELEVSEVVPCRGVCAVYQWVTESWSFCSINTVDEGSACGEGVQSRKIRCVLRGDGVNESHSVNDSLCDQDDVPAQARTCTLPCPDDCVMSPWSHWSLCPMSCDVNSVRTRQMLRPPAAHATCPERNETEPCVVNANCFTYQYNASGWSSCMLGEHAVCGEGSRSRLLDCIRSDGKLVDLSVCEE